MTGSGDDAVLDRLAALDTPVLSDALDHLGLPGATTGLRPLWPVDRVVVGRARTLQAGPKVEGGPQQHIATSVVASAHPRDLVVIANEGRTDVSCWGGILAVGAVAKEVAGVVIDGACRDIVESEQLDLPIFGKAVVPVSARTRIVQHAADVPITIAGVVVEPGDYVVADRCGVVFVPSARAVEVLDRAEALTRREAAMAAAVQQGESIVDVMHDSKFDLSKMGAQ